MSRELPEVVELLEARDWLFAGAPSAARDHDPKHAVKILIQLIEALPAIIPMYCYGTEENKASYLRTFHESPK